MKHVRLSWSTVSGATDYEAYYQLSSNTSGSVDTTSTPVSVGTTSLTKLNITSGLFQGFTYTFYVVSYADNGTAVLPSENTSLIQTIGN